MAWKEQVFEVFGVDMFWLLHLREHLSYSIGIYHHTWDVLGVCGIIGFYFFPGSPGPSVLERRNANYMQSIKEKGNWKKGNYCGQVLKHQANCYTH